MHGEGEDRPAGTGSSPLKTILLVHPVLHAASTYDMDRLVTKLVANHLRYDTGNTPGSQREKRSMHTSGCPTLQREYCQASRLEAWLGPYVTVPCRTYVTPPAGTTHTVACDGAFACAQSTIS